jgi:hypothetical protein
VGDFFPDHPSGLGLSVSVVAALDTEFDTDPTRDLRG